MAKRPKCLLERTRSLRFESLYNVCDFHQHVLGIRVLYFELAVAANLFIKKFVE